MAAALETPPGSPGNALEIRNLFKRYGSIEAVRDLSFTVARGEIFGLLGLNGAGKTTTLECLLGLRRADSGTIFLEEIDVSTQPLEARKRVGAQLQAAALQDKITSRQALKLFAAFYKRTSDFDEMLARFGLTDKAEQPFDSLSGGQKQRLFLALAMVHEPSLVVLDEPTAGLDPAARHELHGHLRAVRQSGRTTLLSTHDLTEAESLCDRLGLLHEGRLIALGTPTELVASSRAKPRLTVRTARPLVRAEVERFPGLRTGLEGQGVWSFEMLEANEPLGALLAHLAQTSNTLLDLRIERPTLEDVFLELTGKAWSEEVPSEAR